MNHFTFENAVNDLVKMDGPLQQGPAFRWQRKSSQSASSALNKSGTPGRVRARSMSSTRTPGKELQNTPGRTRLSTTTPGKTPGKGHVSRSKTPRKTPKNKTPGRAEDRFIPNRATTDMELSHFAMMRLDSDAPSNTNENYQQHLDQALTKGQNPHDAKILSYRNKVPSKDGHHNNLKVLYSVQQSTNHKPGKVRHIPDKPDRILDAPDLINDYYLNLLDWSPNNHLAVALGAAVYLWNAGNGSIVQLMELEGEEFVSCVNWIHEGNILGIGKSTGCVQLWDAGQQKLIRTMSGHAGRVGALSWNNHILTSGSRTGAIHHHDVRVAQHHVATLAAHTQEVCGLKWSLDGRRLASGSNDNNVMVWDAGLGMNVPPLFTLTHHQAAVKALAWCPWNPQLLASGGGTNDRHIRFWNIQNGACLNAVDTNSQVCAILWSKEYRELITGHGFAQNQLTIWKYPSMTKVADLKGHTDRILAMTMSPDGAMVASAAADETIRLWNCFAVDKSQKTVRKPKDTTGLSMLHGQIR